MNKTLSNFRKARINELLDKCLICATYIVPRETIDCAWSDDIKNIIKEKLKQEIAKEIKIDITTETLFMDTHEMIMFNAKTIVFTPKEFAELIKLIKEEEKVSLLQERE